MNKEITLHTIATYDDKEYELQDLLNNLLNECQRKDNIINDLKSSIADYQEAVGDYQDEIVRKDNNWNELKKHIGEEWYCYDNESIEFKVAKDILDKINELENSGSDE